MDFTFMLIILFILVGFIFCLLLNKDTIPETPDQTEQELQAVRDEDQEGDEEEDVEEDEGEEEGDEEEEEEEKGKGKGKKVSVWEEIKDMDINEAREVLRRKGKQVSKMIPQFPQFPQLWLLPPSDKGEYASLGEKHCIEFLQLLFPGSIFQKVRPKWLRNPKTGRCLELDGYCEDMQIAIEYNGYQHYEWPNVYMETEEEFLAQKYRDRIKEEICKKRNIFLIRISYMVKLERIPLAIYCKLLDGLPI